MKICITALLAVLVAQGGDAFALPGIGIGTRAMTMTSVSPADTDFYCTTITTMTDVSDAFPALTAFFNGENNEGIKIWDVRAWLIIATETYASAEFCLAASTSRQKATSSDGSIYLYTIAAGEEMFAVVQSPPPTDEDLKAGFETLKTEVDSAGLTARANMDRPMVMIIYGTAYYFTLLSPA